MLLLKYRVIEQEDTKMKWYLLLTNNGQDEIQDTEYNFRVDAQEAGNKCVDEGKAEVFSVFNEEFKEHIEAKVTIQ